MRADTGRAGEEAAVRFLEKNGYRILERNTRSALGEIDIIASEKDVICFVEVRARKGAVHRVEALESVGRTKQDKLSRLAVSYLKKKRWLDRSARFDVAAVTFDNGITEVTLLKDAFPVCERYRMT